MKRTLVLALPLALASSAVAQVASDLFEISLVFGEWRTPVTLDERGLFTARQFLSRYSGDPGYRETAAWRTLQVLKDARFQEEVRRVLDLSGEGPARIELHAYDRSTPLFPGERLRIPGDGHETSHRVLPGETVASIAQNYQLRRQEVLEFNRQRFRLEPLAPVHPQRSWFQGDLITETRAVRIGEELAGDWTDETLEARILHGVARLRHDSPCRDDGEKFGPDGKVTKDEVLTPAAALTEGLALYHVGNLSESLRQELITPPSFWFYEIVPGGRSSRETHVGVPWNQVTVNDRLSQPVSVGGTLLLLDDLPAGRPGTEEAIRQSRSIPCRTIGDVLRVYAQIHPDLRGRIRRLVRDSTIGPMTPVQIDDLLDAGILPNCQTAWMLARPRDPFFWPEAGGEPLVPEPRSVPAGGVTTGRTSTEFDSPADHALRGVDPCAPPRGTQLSTPTPTPVPTPPLTTWFGSGLFGQ